MKAALTYCLPYQILFWGFSILLSVSCQKGETDTPTPAPSYTYNFPPEMYSIITKEQLDLFRNAKMPVHEGTNPPQIFEGTICSLCNPPVTRKKINFSVDHTCITDNKNPNNQGVKYDGFTTSIEIYVDTNKNIVSSVSYASRLDNGAGSGFASGTGDNFSAIFKVEKGEVNDIPYQALWIVSGTVSRNANRQIIGINKFHAGFLMLSKGNDPGNKKVANPGTIRIFKDPDEKSDRVF